MKLLTTLAILIVMNLTAFSQLSNVITPDKKMDDTTYCYGVDKVNKMINQSVQLNRQNDLLLNAENEIRLLRGAMAAKDSLHQASQQQSSNMFLMIKEHEIKENAYKSQIDINKDEIKYLKRKNRLLGFGTGSTIVIGSVLLGILILK